MANDAFQDFIRQQQAAQSTGGGEKSMGGAIGAIPAMLGIKLKDMQGLDGLNPKGWLTDTNGLLGGKKWDAGWKALSNNTAQSGGGSGISFEGSTSEIAAPSASWVSRTSSSRDSGGSMEVG